jgi:hypothetical protein
VCSHSTGLLAGFLGDCAGFFGEDFGLAGFVFGSDGGFGPILAMADP